MTARRHGVSTVAVHGPAVRRPDWAPVAPPIIQSSTFTNPVGSEEEILYSRYGTNPTQVALAKKYALLEGTEDAIFVASGSGATALAHLAVLRPGDHLLSSEWIYGETRQLFDLEFARLGIEVSYVRPDRVREWRKSMRKTTRAIFIETPTNPLLRVLDLRPVATLARDEGLALLVDATFASPVNFRPAEAGADVVITQRDEVPERAQRRRSRARWRGRRRSSRRSAASCGCGGRRSIHTRRGWWTAGSAPSRCAWSGTTRTGSRWRAGPRPSGGSRRSTTRGSTPIPTTSSRPRCSAATGEWSGSSSAADRRPRSRLLSRLKLIIHAPSLAGVESLVSEPRLTSHRGLSPAERERLGIPDGFLRLSCGIEDADGSSSPTWSRPAARGRRYRLSAICYPLSAIRDPLVSRSLGAWGASRAPAERADSG